MEHDEIRRAALGRLEEARREVLDAERLSVDELAVFDAAVLEVESLGISPRDIPWPYEVEQRHEVEPPTQGHGHDIEH